MSDFSTIDDYVQGGVKGFLSQFDLEKFIGIEPQLESIKMTLQLFPLFRRDDGKVFIPIGTPQMPSGIRKFTAQAIVISNFKDDEPVYTTKNDLRDIIVENKDVFTTSMDESYKVLGKFVEYDTLIDLINKKKE